MRYVLVSVLLLSAISVSAGQLNVSVPLDPSAIHYQDAGLYTIVTAPGMTQMGTEGQPALPMFDARVALPTGTRATSIEITDATYTPIRGRFEVMPAVPPQIISSEPGDITPNPDPAVYGSSATFPAVAARLTSSSVVAGIPVAYLDVFPVRWNPADGVIEVLTSLTISVNYEDDPTMRTVQRRSLESENRSQQIVRNFVVNPDDVASSGATIVPAKDLTYGEYVIITYPDYQSYAQDLADWKTSKGIPTNVYTTTWIQSQYSCTDLQQEIRAFLTDCRDEGVEYVLIYGDDDKVAGRDVKIAAGGELEYPPIDLYFADINDTAPGADLWDSNGNGVWGEYGVDDVDYHPDLWVGRASVNTTGECTIFNDKVFDYEQIASTDYFETSPIELRIGYSTGYLWNGSSGPMYGSADAEYISNNYLPSGWAEAKCYESTGNNSSAITQAMINDGPAQIFHGSHGAETSMYTSNGSNYTVSQIMAQTNISSGNLPAIWNSFSCLIGAFDYGSDCCADAWLNSPNGGGFGDFNARYGWGSTATSGQLSEAVALSFYEEMWDNDQFNLGVAHGTGLDALSPPSDEYYDWCVKEYNLFGDPELPMWYQDADQLDATHPSSIAGATNVTVTVTSGGSPVSGARVCLQKGDWQTGEVYEIGTTNGSGQVTLYVSPTSTGSISVVAWARDYISYIGSITVTGVGIADDPQGLQAVNATGAIYPSPASSSASIPFSLASPGQARVDVYDITGRIVTTLAAEDMTAGAHSLIWDLRDASGTPVPSGLYSVRITSNGWTGTTSFVIAR